MNGKTLIVLFLLSVGGCAVDAAVIREGSQVGSSGGTEYYTIVTNNITYTTLTINGTWISFVFPSSKDVITSTGVVDCNNVTTCNIPPTNTSGTLWVGSNLIESTSTVTILNYTGNSTDLNICYNSTATGNITLTMTALAGDCNYGRFEDTNDNVRYVNFDRAITAFTSCDVVVILNNTATYNACFDLREDETVSETSLATILAALAVTSSLVTKAHRWDTQT